MTHVCLLRAAVRDTGLTMMMMMTVVIMMVIMVMMMMVKIVQCTRLLKQSVILVHFKKHSALKSRQ